MKPKARHNRVRSKPKALADHQKRASTPNTRNNTRPSAIGRFGVSLRYERFCREYVIDGNATQAAVRAGYAVTAASVQGCRLLRNAKIRWLIDRFQHEQGARVDASADRVREELAKMAFFNAIDYVDNSGVPLPIHALTRDQAAAVVGFEIEGRGKVKKLKLADKRQAAVDLGRHFGMFIDRTEHSGDPSNPVRFVIDGLDVGPEVTVGVKVTR